jgi:RNA polymerase sigma-70 factor (ECF subfamily)
MDDGERIDHDRRWLRAVLAGDDIAWRVQYDAVFPAVHAYVLWRCGGIHDLADDVMQETWLTAVRRIGTFTPERGPLATWVSGIAGNVVRNAIRNRKRRSARVVALVGTETEDQTEPEQAERAERTAAALAELPEHYEKTLRDKYLLGKSVAEMAAARGESFKAVESQLTRAREAFRQAYRAQELDHG